MTIASKLYFDFKKEYPELLASDVAEFVATKDYEQDLLNYKNSITTEEVLKNGKVDYIRLKKDGVSLMNFRGDLQENINEVSENKIYETYKNELADFVLNKLAN